MTAGLESRLSVKGLVNRVSRNFVPGSQIAALFENCFVNTLLGATERQSDNSTFVITGDIPAMWLRDSSAQVRPYLVLSAEDKVIADTIEGVIQRQLFYIRMDPYANAFNREANGKGHQEDNTAMSPWIWERKYEVDSLCYPIQLSYLFWKATGRTSHFGGEFVQAVELILNVWEMEQDHSRSPYSFQRYNCVPSDTLTNQGRGSKVVPTGMTWSGFRPSDDACTYGYLVPSNMFAVVVLGYLMEISKQVLGIDSLYHDAAVLRNSIAAGIHKYGIYNDPEFGQMYAYETDGTGRYNLMDDANIPSLLGAPYIGYCDNTDLVYQNTRQFVLSKKNPYFFSGTAAKGVGSPHTPAGYVWPIALAIQGLTASTTQEKEDVLATLVATDGHTNLMHESFDVNSPEKFTRPWFGWANALFCELVMALNGIYIPGTSGYRNTKLTNGKEEEKHESA